MWSEGERYKITSCVSDRNEWLYTVFKQNIIQSCAIRHMLCIQYLHCNNAVEYGLIQAIGHTGGDAN